MGVGDEGAGAGGGTCAKGGSTQHTHEVLWFWLKASAAGVAGSMLDALTSEHDTYSRFMLLFALKFEAQQQDAQASLGMHERHVMQTLFNFKDFNTMQNKRRLHSPVRPQG
jgi:hypothetical protein